MKSSRTSQRHRIRRLILSVILFAAAALAPLPSHAQGCSLCKDNAAATPPSTQRAYRHAILLLTITAGGLFVTAVSLLRRNQ